MRDVHGISASAGLVLGPAKVWQRPSFQVKRRHVQVQEVAHELESFESALEVTRVEIQTLRDALSEELGEEHASILDAQLLILEDEDLLDASREGITREHLSAGAAFVRAMGEAILPLTLSGDSFFRERVVDFQDVEQRLIRALLGGTEPRMELTEPAIVVAADLSPSATAILDTTMILGFCLDEGGPTGHTAIIARSLGVPCIVGLGDLSQSLQDGDQLLVDGGSGHVIVAPPDAVRHRFEARIRRRRQAEEKLLKLRDYPAVTPDGHTIELAANVELPVEISLALANGAKGIGLLRTEYFYFQHGQLPNEEDQLEAYREVLRRAQGETVIFRILDVGGDKVLAAMGGYREYNPFLGWRGVRYLLSNPDLLGTQLRALYRASADGPVKIMVPMVSGVTELQRFHEMAKRCRDELTTKGQAFDPDVELGIMVETPSAVAMAPELARQSDFFSIGTNDLTQYILAVDRTNVRVAHLHRPQHPAVLRAIQSTIDAGHEAGIWVGLCGEMGSNPTYAVLLMGMGIDEISCNAAAVPLVKKAIRSITFEAARGWAKEALLLSTASEVDGYLRLRTQQGLRDILHQDEE